MGIWKTHHISPASTLPDHVVLLEGGASTRLSRSQSKSKQSKQDR